jgi:excisionase family DNA binding protein
VSALDALNLREEIEALVDERIAQALRRRLPSKRWLTVREAADYLGLSEVAVRARMKRGRIPVRHNGRSVAIDRQALDRLIEEDA